MQKLILYRIKNKVNDLYSTGSTKPNFRKIGKLWRKPGDLLCHLHLMNEYNLVERYYMDCVVETMVAEGRRVDWIDTNILEWYNNECDTNTGNDK